MPSLSSSYNISGLVPACWLLFQWFVLKPAKLPKIWYIWTCPCVFLRDEQWKWTKTYMITCIYIMSRIVHSYFVRFWRYSDKQTNKLLFLLLPYEVYFRDIPDFGSPVALATWQTDRLVNITSQCVFTACTLTKKSATSIITPILQSSTFLKQIESPWQMNPDESFNMGVVTNYGGRGV